MLEEAAAYQQLIEDFGLTHEEVAIRVGRSRTAVTNTLRLLQLPPTVQRLVRDRSLTMGHARALLGTPDRALQEQLRPSGSSPRGCRSARSRTARVPMVIPDRSGAGAPATRTASADAGDRPAAAARACSSSRASSATTSTPG